MGERLILPIKQIKYYLLPPNALTTDTTISAIGGRSNFAIPGGSRWLLIMNFAFAIFQSLFSNGFKMYYTDADLVAAGIAEANLKPKYFNGSAWLIFLLTHKIQTANYIEFTTDHFSDMVWGEQ